jgi:CDP-diacylglycerol---glycerol-3-phosphate 3-phosphatidyltransferase
MKLQTRRGVAVDTGLRRFSSAAFHPIGHFLARFLTPNLLTASSLLVSVAVGWCFMVGRFFLGAWLLLLAGMLDVFDGQVAKLTNRVSVFGAFFDSTVDRVSDFLYAAGVMYYFVYHPPGDPYYDLVFLVLAYLFVSQLISYIKARAESLGFTCNVGLLARPLRMLFFGIAVFLYGINDNPWAIRIPLIVIIALGLETALHRFIHVWLQARRVEKDGAGAVEAG